jgi:hemerythrin-like metal-binding protein
MARHSYADSAAHIAEHKKLVADVVAFTQKLDSGKATISIELLRFLRGWLTTHIMHTDQQLGKALSAAGVA